MKANHIQYSWKEGRFSRLLRRLRKIGYRITTDCFGDRDDKGFQPLPVSWIKTVVVCRSERTAVAFAE